MAISVLDVHHPVVPRRVAVPSLRLVAPPVGVPVAAPAAPVASPVRRLPVAVLAAGLLGIVESVALLALALTGLDGVVACTVVVPGWGFALGLVALAGWIVLCAGGGAALLDGAGRRLVVGVAVAELALLALLIVVTTTTSLFAAPRGGLPLPLLLLMVTAVPVGKLLLVGAPSAMAWIAEGPRVRERRVDPVAAHRLLATVTLGLIGASLAAVAVLAPVQGGGIDAPASAVFSQH